MQPWMTDLAQQLFDRAIEVYTEEYATDPHAQSAQLEPQIFLARPNPAKPEQYIVIAAPQEIVNMFFGKGGSRDKLVSFVKLSLTSPEVPWPGSVKSPAECVIMLNEVWTKVESPEEAAKRNGESLEHDPEAGTAVMATLYTKDGTFSSYQRMKEGKPDGEVQGKFKPLQGEGKMVYLPQHTH